MLRITIMVPLLLSSLWRRVRDRFATDRGRQRGFHLGMLVAGFVALAIVGAHAGLIPVGRWQVDEFRFFATLHQWGADPGVLTARLEYSPRPFSELLILLYGEAVLHLHRPLITSFLAVIWTGLITSVGFAAFTALPHSAWRLSMALAFTLALIATALTGANVTEAFYWPAAAAAYVPTLAAALCLFFLIGYPMSRRRRTMSGIALAVAACSSEVGAAFALCFALTVAAERLLAVLRRRIRPAAALLASAWWLTPGAIGLLVFLTILHLRSGISELGAANAYYTGRSAASALAATRDLAAELAVGSDPRLGWPLVARVCTKVLFTVGFAASWRLAAPDAARLDRGRVALGVALLGAAFFSVVVAYYHYGQLCCERQQSVRQSFLALALLVLAVPALAAWPWANAFARRIPVLPPMLLAAGLMLPLLWRSEGLRSSYAAFHWSIEARARSWASGLQPGTGGMIFYLPPDGAELLVQGTGVPRRTYGEGLDVPPLVQDVERFFGKESVTVCDAFQTDRNWVVGGQLIPACILPPGS